MILGLIGLLSAAGDGAGAPRLPPIGDLVNLGLVNPTSWTTLSLSTTSISTITFFFSIKVKCNSNN